MIRILRWLGVALCGLCLQGCTIATYHRGKAGQVSFVGITILENGALSKLSIDRMIKTNRWGVAIGQFNETVDNDAIKSISDGVSSAVLKGLGVP